MWGMICLSAEDLLSNRWDELGTQVSPPRGSVMRRRTASGGSEAGALSSVISTGAVRGSSSRGSWRMDVLAGGAPAGETVLDLSALKFRVTRGDLKKKQKQTPMTSPTPNN